MKTSAQALKDFLKKVRTASTLRRTPEEGAALRHAEELFRYLGSFLQEARFHRPIGYDPEKGFSMGATLVYGAQAFPLGTMYFDHPGEFRHLSNRAFYPPSESLVEEALAALPLHEEEAPAIGLEPKVLGRLLLEALTPLYGETLAGALVRSPVNPREVGASIRRHQLALLGRSGP